jgi:aspartate-semialdehyde dehydrogenase
MSQQIDVAVLGATGLVGQQILEILAERDFPIGKLYPLASSRSVGKTIEYKGETIEVIDVDTFDWSLAQIGFFSAGGARSKKYAPLAGDAGCIVIDNTSEFRNEPDIPLVVPEVNPQALADFRNRNIIANPNCSTIQMVVALKPIHDAVGINRINVSTYQSVSGAGTTALETLISQFGHVLNGRSVEDDGVFAKQMAFNTIPQIDVFLDNDYTKEEMKMVWETQKIMGDESIRVNATAVRVPVLYGHGEAINIETNMPIDAQSVKDLLREAPGIKLTEDSQQYPTQVSDASGNDDVHVGRVRDDISHENGINLWVVSDNVRKGAATNSIQIAELLIRDYL